MVLFNYSTRELTAKIVYYGPGLCGKTTNLQYIYDSLPDTVKKGKMLSLATKADRTLFFDFLPIDLGTIRGMKTRVQLYTVPGQVFYNSTRKLVLKGADGIVFVADSQSKMLEANGESYKNLEDNLREMGLKLDEIPLVMQFNKRDLPNLSSIEEMNTRINRHNAPFYEAVATTGIGVEDTLKAITKLVLNNLAAKYRLEGVAPAAEAAPQGRPRPAPAPPAGRPEAAPSPAAGPPPAPAAEAAQEDIALDALEIGASAEPARPPAAAPPAAAASPGPVPLAAAAGPGAASLDLGEEIELEGLDEAPEGTVDLGEDLLQELEEEPVAAGMQAGPRPPGPAAAPAPGDAPGPRAVRRPAPVEEQPIDLDEPIDLDGDGWDAASPAAGEPREPAVIDIGPVSPGRDGVIEVPVSATVEGRPVRLTLRVSVRVAR